MGGKSVGVAGGYGSADLEKPMTTYLDRLLTSENVDLRIWPEYYAAVLEGTKRFEVRLDDRDYQVGKVYWLREWVPAVARCAEGILGQDDSHYTGRSVIVVISYVLRDVPGLASGYCVWGFHILESRCEPGSSR
jgi:hypothetical protein